MNIYRFIQSKSVREYLEKINYTFSSLEIAYIIWQCPDATLTERFDAWQEIIDTMPDASLPDSMEISCFGVRVSQLSLILYQKIKRQRK